MMYKFLKFVTLCLLLGVFILSGCDINDPSDKPGTVQGIVGNEQTGELLQGISVSSDGNILASTDEFGFYSFELSHGTYELYFSGEGFITRIEEEVVVKAGKTTELNVLLNPVEIVDITGNIGSLGANWTSAKIYHINNNITISGLLSIGPGTIIKFKENAGFLVNGANNGKINALGTQLQPISFTSWHDDTAGGDTNGNGNATQPSRGDWESITIDGTGNNSIFENCLFKYGGSGDETIKLNSGTIVSISDCILAHNAGEKGAVNASAAASATLIADNAFEDNALPLTINSGISLDNSNTFDQSGADDINAVFISNFATQGTAVWMQTQVPFIFPDNHYSINAGSSLQISAGVMLKFSANAYWDINGVITVNGTQAEPVYFTSHQDDAVGGDTNKDGSATVPAAGDWGYIKVNGLNNSSSFRNCHFLYGGGYLDDYTLCLNNDTGVAVEYCVFKNNRGENNAALNARAAGSNTSIKENYFYLNIKPLQINGKISIDNSNKFRNPDNYTQSNTYNGIFVDSPGEVCSIIGDIVWAENEVGVAYVSLHSGINIGAGNSLTLAADVILKFDGGSLYYQGDNLINHDAAGVWFTSYYDDEHGEDTNGDGSATSPAAGDWQGINNQGSWEDWDNILYSAN